MWPEVAGIAQNLREGLAVVLTVPYRLPIDAGERAALVKEVVARILAGSGASLGGGAGVRIQPFNPAGINVAREKSHAELRKALDAVTVTSLSGILCVGHSMTQRSMNATQDKHRYGG